MRITKLAVVAVVVVCVVGVLRPMHRSPGALTEVWKHALATPEQDMVSDVYAAPDGSLYVVGSTGGALFGPSHGGNDAFIAKYSADGALLWSHQEGSLGSDGFGIIAPTPTGDIWVIGRTTGEWYGPAKAKGDLVLVQYAPDGSVVRGVQAGNDAYAECGGAAVDSAGNVYVVGRVDGDLNGDPPVVEGSGFYCKFSPTGQLVWARRFTNKGETDCRSIALAPDGSIYLAGQADNLFTPAPPDESCAQDAYICKVSSSGDIVWGRQFGGPDVGDYANTVCVDGTGGVYLTGVMNQPVWAESGEQPETHVSFLAKYSSSGEQLWLNQTQAGLRLESVQINSAGQLVVGGDATVSCLGTTPLGDTDFVCAAYTSGGSLVWADRVGTPADDYASCIVDGTGALIVFGFSEGGLGGPAQGSDDGFIMKLHP